MDQAGKQKFFEITLEKLVYALVVGAASAGMLFWANSRTEHLKPEEAIRQAEMTEFVKVMGELWQATEEYEDLLKKSTASRVSDHYFGQRPGNPTYKELIHQRELERIAEEKSRSVAAMARQKRFVIGQDLCDHISRYLGLLQTRAFSDVQSRISPLPEVRKSSEESVKELDLLLQAMRFDAVAARKFAMERSK